ncbi:PDZ domain-containing protein [Pseudomonadota bacterium]
MRFDWDNWGAGGKTIFIAACVAILSMFMNWVDIGITTRIGISQQAFLLLGFWIYPVVMLFNNKPINLAWGLLCSALSFVATAIYIASKTIELFGETTNVAAVGAWVFIGASAALGAGVVKYNSVNIINKRLVRGGLEVTQIGREALGEKADLKLGDVIVNYCGVDVRNHPKLLADEMLKYKSDETVPIILLRDYERVIIDVPGGDLGILVQVI